jgi:drug/metabolite transporter (DMT)-like permease
MLPLGRKSRKHSHKQSRYPTDAGRCQQISHSRLSVVVLCSFKWLVTFLRAKGHNHGIIIGCLFGTEFLFIYWGLAFTTASRSVIFLYTHPFWVALGAHFIFNDDRLTSKKIAGLFLAFGGIVAVFRSHSEQLPSGYWLGDLMELAAAFLWASTTLYIKRMSRTRRISHYQTLFAQLLYSIPILAAGWAMFEKLEGPHFNAVALTAFGYQCVVVAFFSYILWFWMISRFSVSRLTAFTFFAPLFGTVLGAVALSEPVTPMVWIGLALVGVGIYLVNRSPKGKDN